MAERIVCRTFDDLDGTEIADGSGEHIEFSLRSVFYQLDLSSANVAKLELALRPFIDAADTVSGTPRNRRRNSRVKARG